MSAEKPPSLPDIFIPHTTKSVSDVVEEILAVLVRAKMLTVSGAIGDRINEKITKQNAEAVNG